MTFLVLCRLRTTSTDAVASPAPTAPDVTPLKGEDTPQDTGKEDAVEPGAAPIPKAAGAAPAKATAPLHCPRMWQ